MTSRQYHQLTSDHRYQIFALKASGISTSKIAVQLGFHRATIYRELKRHTQNDVYNPKIAHETTQIRRRHRKNIPVIFTEDLRQKIRPLLCDNKWSPRQISGRLKREGEKTVSHETIYKWIWQDKKQGGDLHKSLRRKGKAYQKRGDKRAGRGQIPNRTDISERPKIVEAKARIGDIEGDLIMGQQGTGAILSLVDRRSKRTWLRLLTSKEAYDTRVAIEQTLYDVRDGLKSLTFDNGKEFAYHEDMTAVLGVRVYFCTPYHSWERGLNEHTNGLVRQYAPKGMDFRRLTPEIVQRIEDALNDRPRESLGFETPNEVFFRALMAERHVALDG